MKHSSNILGTGSVHALACCLPRTPVCSFCVIDCKTYRQRTISFQLASSRDWSANNLNMFYHRITLTRYHFPWRPNTSSFHPGRNARQCTFKKMSTFVLVCTGRKEKSFDIFREDLHGHPNPILCGWGEDKKSAKHWPISVFSGMESSSP